MRDDRRHFIVNQETDHKVNDGLAKAVGYIGFAVFLIAVLDHYLTVAWHWLANSLAF